MCHQQIELEQPLEFHDGLEQGRSFQHGIRWPGAEPYGFDTGMYEDLDPQVIGIVEDLPSFDGVQRPRSQGHQQTLFP